VFNAATTGTGTPGGARGRSRGPGSRRPQYANSPVGVATRPRPARPRPDKPAGVVWSWRIARSSSCTWRSGRRGARADRHDARRRHCESWPIRARVVACAPEYGRGGRALGSRAGRGHGGRDRRPPCVLLTRKTSGRDLHDDPPIAAFSLYTSGTRDTKGADCTGTARCRRVRDYGSRSRDHPGGPVLSAGQGFFRLRAGELCCCPDVGQGRPVLGRARARPEIMAERSRGSTPPRCLRRATFFSNMLGWSSGTPSPG